FRYYDACCKPRLPAEMKALRAAVSGSRVRYMQDGFDLDLTYITPKLIAMGYPASGVEKTYRNDINEVRAAAPELSLSLLRLLRLLRALTPRSDWFLAAKVANFLNSRHPDAYRVYNLSERAYDYTKFEGRVSECGFPDHHPPPLQLLLDIVNDMIEWVAKGSKHVLVVHCLAGKGRTGVVCSCYLLLTGYYGSIFKLRKERELRELANSSIRDFWNARGQGVRFPSQALYIYYFIKVLRRLGRMPTQIPRLRPAKKMLLRSIVLNGVPDFEAPPRGGCTPFLQVLPAPSQHNQPHLLYNSSWQQPKFETYLADPQGSIMFEVNVEVQGDTLVRCLHANTTTILGKHMAKMFHFSFNTDFFHNNNEIDDAADSQRFPAMFQVVCHLQMLDPNGDPFPPSASSSSSTLHSSSSSSIRDDNAEQLARPRSAPQHRRMTTPAQQPVQMQPQPSQKDLTPTMMGWLYKQGGFVKNWKKRWFVAREGKLTYYNGASDATPLGVVNLRRVTVDSCELREVNARNKNLHYFKVVPPSADQRTYFFGANSEQDLVGWIHVLGAQSAYGLARLGSGLQRRPGAARSNTFSIPTPHQQQLQTQNQALSGFRRRQNSSGSHSSHDGSTRASLPSGVLSAPASMLPLQQVRQSAQFNSTELSFHLPPEDADLQAAAEAAVSASTSSSGRRESLPNDVTSAMQRSLELRASSFTDCEEQEGDRLSSTSASAMPPCRPAQPVADLTSTLSAREQESLLQEVNGFQGGIYIYSADELQDAARLQKHLRETRVAPPPGTNGGNSDSDPVPADSLTRYLQQLVALKQMDEAEKLLTQLVLTKFPSLIDAMDHDPLAFTQLIAGGDIALAGRRLQEQAAASQGNSGHRRAIFF
ncbi:hypothetical protein BBJ28_00021365, partial [Nothophytophthora sp. Chile5]